MRVLAFVAVLAGNPLGQERLAAPGHWPQWRGPGRENVSAETGLLKAWPEAGPPLLWKSTELGDGFPPVSVAGGRIYGLGFREGKEFVTALDGDGKTVWSQPIGPHSGEYPAMRYVSQRSVTVDDALLYAFTAAGTQHCLSTADGKVVWTKPYAQLGGVPASFFQSDAPLVEGDLLLCKPGGNQGHVTALHKRTGAVVWQSKGLKGGTTAAPLIVAEIGGIRQAIVLTMDEVAGVVVKTGILAWRAERKGQTAVVPTPLCHDGIVFVTSGFGVGGHAFRISAEAGRFKAEPAYSGPHLTNMRGGMVRIGEHLYGTTETSLICAEFKTGKILWQDRCVGKGSVTAADGHLVVRGERGAVAWVAAVSDAFCEVSRFMQAGQSPEPTLSQPVIAGGRLYLRDAKDLLCFDLRGPDYKDPPAVWKTPPVPKAAAPAPPVKEKGPDAAFVATPQDVVEKMIELAKVGKDDVVYDLGSGDGRIVITASLNHGCKSVGFEINSALVWESQHRVKQMKLEALVSIEEKDLFTVDLAPASVVTLYLGAPNNAKLLPALRKLRPGARIVSHAHLLGEDGPKPDQTVKMLSKTDQEEHVLHLWTAPLK